MATKDSKAGSAGERLFNGLVKENPTFVLMLGMCPTLAVTTSAINGLSMGLSTTVVLVLSNLFISLLRKIIPDRVRIPAFIVIIASFVTMISLLLEAFLPSIYDALGLYISLIVVNCIILGRAEAYAYSHGPILSVFDGLGMGFGFTLALTLIGMIRELLGFGSIFSFDIMPEGYVPAAIFILAPGAFFVLAFLTAIMNKIKEAMEKKGKDTSKFRDKCEDGCDGCIMAASCAMKKEEPQAEEASAKEETASNEASLEDVSEDSAEGAEDAGLSETNVPGDSQEGKEEEHAE